MLTLASYAQPACSSIVQAPDAATVSMSIQNNTLPDTVYAFVTGQAIGNGDSLMLPEADGQTPYYPASPSTGSPALQYRPPRIPADLNWS